MYIPFIPVERNSLNQLPVYLEISRNFSHWIYASSSAEIISVIETELEERDRKQKGNREGERKELNE